jgi:coproporphyrinogen III oxidase-like Fe-S oxidoreductase
VSLYQLTIEPETAFARRFARGELVPPDLEAAADLYEATQEACAAMGFPAYEISNHARGAQARARHNLLYWRGGDWIGVGPGAHGRLTHEGVRIATESCKRPGGYIEAVNQRGISWASEEHLTSEAAADELLLMGLRIDEGVDLARIETLRGRRLNRDAMAWLVEQGLIVVEGDSLRLTPQARVVTNKIVAELAA